MQEKSKELKLILEVGKIKVECLNYNVTSKKTNYDNIYNKTYLGVEMYLSEEGLILLNKLKELENPKINEKIKFTNIFREAEFCFDKNKAELDDYMIYENANQTRYLRLQFKGEEMSIKKLS